MDRSRSLSPTEIGSCWLGVGVSSKEITLVDVEIESTTKARLRADESIKLQNGPRPAAYAILRQRIVDYISAHKIVRLVIKASAAPQRGVTLPLLEVAEVRGVVTEAAAAVGCEIDVRNMATTSRTFGARKAGEYIDDDSYWAQGVIQPQVRKGSREVAYLLLASLGDAFNQ